MEMIEKYIHGKFIEWGVRFIGVVDNVDTNIKGNKKARQINGLINEWYLDDLSDNVKATPSENRATLSARLLLTVIWLTQTIKTVL